MQKTLYYDCFSGISGDMNLGALIDLGADIDYLNNELSKLNLEGFTLNVNKDHRNGIWGTKLDVKLNKKQKHHTHHKEISKLIEESGLSDRVKSDSLKIFKVIAEAEAKIHNTTIEDVAFHEVGAIDSIVDIVGAAICLEYLKVDSIVASTVVLGSGFVNTKHGVLPVPAPATLEILKNIPVIKGDIPFEATTPTGAGFLAALADQFTNTIHFNTEKIGYGIGTKKEGKKPNLLRIIMGTSDTVNDELIENNMILECNVDDMNPEHFDFLFEVLYKHGAYDVSITPIIMKKSRPAFNVEVLCNPDSAEVLLDQIFRHTSSLGVKKYPVQKHHLKRETIIRETPWGEVRCKRSYNNKTLLHEKPEYDDCKKLAQENNIRIAEVIDYINAQREI